MNDPAICGRCGERNRGDAAYCATCGAPISVGRGLGAIVDMADVGDVATSEHVDAPRFGETGPAVVPSASPPSMDASSFDSAPPPSQTPTQAFAVIPPTAIPAPTPTPPGSAPALVSSKSTSLMIAVLAVMVVALLGGVFLLVSSGPDDVVQPVSDPATAALDTEPGVPETDITSTVPDTVAPDSTLASTVATVASTTMPLDPVPDPDLTPTRALGDLGLDQPILDEACDGRFITFVGSAVGDLPYSEVVSTLLAEYPGTNYIWTKACPSLRQEFSDGSDIYGVVFGPYPTLAEACAAAAFGPVDAYVRRISTTDPPEHTVDC